MKILYIYKALAVWGGVERILVDKMNYLCNVPSYEVYMLTTDQGTHEIPYQFDSRIHYEDLKIRFHAVYTYSGLYRFYEQWRLQRLFVHRLQAKIKEINPDIIISTSELFVEEILRYKGKAKYVVECHSNYAHTRIPGNGHFAKLKMLTRNNYLKRIRKADSLVTLTEGDAREWNRIRKAEVIPNLVHLNPHQIFSSNENKHVIFVGRFAKQKGIDYLIEVWKRIHHTHSDWCLDIYGEGEDKAHYIDIINSYNDHLGINVFSPTKFIFERYCESSILIITSIYEPFGLVIPEAMSCGLPVVSFRSPYGPEDIIEDGKNGFLIDCFDIDFFVTKLAQLMDDVNLRKSMGKNAIERSHKFSPQNIMPLWENLFYRLMN